MSEPILSIKRVRVEYESVVAVDQLSLDVEAGTILGLLGPNGAGKSSLMKAIAGLVEVTSGEIMIGGFSLVDDRPRALGLLGFQPDIPPVYEDLSVYDFLTLFASAYGIASERRDGRVRDVLRAVKLEEKADHPTGGLSRGMTQRLFLAKTLIPDPPLLVLDEPASGLDPVARHEFATLLRELSARGKAIVLSSHILEELNHVCDSLCVMARGEVIDSGRLSEVRARLNPPLELRVELLSERLGTQLAGSGERWSGARTLIESHFGDSVIEIVEDASGYSAKINAALLPQDELKTPDTPLEPSDLVARRTAALIKALVNEGHEPTQVYTREADLQDIFLQLAQERS